MPMPLFARMVAMGARMPMSKKSRMPWMRKARQPSLRSRVRLGTISVGQTNEACWSVRPVKTKGEFRSISV